jgi:hypothetical protein
VEAVTGGSSAPDVGISVYFALVIVVLVVAVAVVIDRKYNGSLYVSLYLEA